MTGEPEPADTREEDLVALAVGVAAALGPRGLTLGTAESCTGGLVGHALTEIPGSSAWYAGGAVVYSDALKERLAGVPAKLLAAHGAVSASATSGCR